MKAFQNVFLPKKNFKPKKKISGYVSKIINNIRPGQSEPTGKTFLGEKNSSEVVSCLRRRRRRRRRPHSRRRRRRNPPTSIPCPSPASRETVRLLRSAGVAPYCVLLDLNPRSQRRIHHLPGGCSGLKMPQQALHLRPVLAPIGYGSR